MRTGCRYDLRLDLLGGWLLTAVDDPSISGQRIDVPSGPEHLIALLALSGRRSRIHTAATLWPDCTEQVAAARLRALLWRFRHRHVGVPPLLEVGASSLALTDTVAVDVHRLRAGAQLLIRGPDPWNAVTEQAAVAVLESEQLLPGWHDDWVLAAREDCTTCG